MEEATKRCKFCGESILEVAKKCKHCGSDLTEGANSVAPVALAKPADYGAILLLIPVVATCLIWFWVGNMALIDRPGNSLTMIGIGTIIATAIVIYMEAAKAGMTSDRKRGTSSPILWFFSVLLLWIICYPLYMYKRRTYGLPNMVVGALLIAVIFALSWHALGSMIDAKVAEIQASLQQIQGQ